MKEKFRIFQENQKATRGKTIKQKPYQRNKYLCCPPRKIFGTFVNWTREELKQMDQKTRKLMTMHKALHLRGDVGRLYISRKEEERGLTSIGDCVDVSIQWLEDYIQMQRRKLITATRNNTDNTRTNRTTIIRKKWEENNCMVVLSDK